MYDKRGIIPFLKNYKMAKIKALKKMSTSTLEDFSGLIYKISNLIENDYKHIIEQMPRDLLNQLSDIRKQIDKEYEERRKFYSF